jgi:TolB-like protein/tetratricopeptide (TPR) repeat protein
MNAILAEMRRRHVFRIGGGYAIVAWLLVQVGSVAFPEFDAPEWAMRVFILFAVLGFPLAMIFAYAFNVPPQDAADSDAAAEAIGPVDLTLAGGVLLVALFAGIQTFQAPANAQTQQMRIASLAPAIAAAPVEGFSGRSAIAVLPFESLSGDPDQEYLASGIADDVTISLYKFKTFPVISNTSTFTYSSRQRDYKKIADEIGAGYILHGSVRKLGEQVRVTAQLVDAQGKQIWAEKYESEWARMLELEEELVLQIVMAIEPQIIRSEAKRALRMRPSDMRAWDYYLRARALSPDSYSFSTVGGERLTLETNAEARRLAQEALKLDPDYAIVHGLLSHIEGVYMTVLRPQVDSAVAAEAMQKSLRHSARARAISPFDATACSCQAFMYLLSGDLSAAISVIDDALKINPTSSMILAGAAKIHQVAGDYEQALTLIEKAKRLSPLDRAMTNYFTWESSIYLGLGDFKKAADVAQKASFVEPLNFDAYVIRALAQTALGDEEAARHTLALLAQVLPNFDPLSSSLDPVPTKLMAAFPEDVKKRIGDGGLPQAAAVVFQDLGWGQGS